MKTKFDLEAFLERHGHRIEKEPWDYEKYKAINPKLSKSMYKFLYGNGGLWKVKCGKRVENKLTGEVLEAVWWLDTPENWENRFVWK